MTVHSKAEGRAFDEIVRLVLGVARLGEADLAGWWASHGMDSVGRYVLRGTFKRTWEVAALELDVLSATRRHDEAAEGRATALHLFSDQLPFRQCATSWLAGQKTRKARAGLFTQLESWTMAEARASLLWWTGCEPSPEVVGRGLLLGELSARELEDEEALLSAARLLAASYLQVSFPFRVPYFNLRG